MKIDKIAFYCPSRITGGTEYLFKRLADYLAENQNEYEVICIDYEDGFLRNNVSSSKVKFITYRDDVKVRIKDGTVVILQLNGISKLNSIIDYNPHKSTPIFWCLHAKNISNIIKFFNFYLVSPFSRRRLGQKIATLTQLRVINFMGYMGCFDVFNELKQPPRKFDWLPNVIEIKSPSSEISFRRKDDSEVRFCWLGRLDYEKSKNIQTYMNELEELSLSFPLKLSIIGVGPAEEMLREKARIYSFDIDFVGEKRDAELDAFIREETEIGLASGTSALEFALRGKPVIVDWVLNKVYHSGERKKYTLACEAEDIDFSVTNRVVCKKESSFINKFIYIIENFEIVAKKEYRYACTKTVDACCDKLLNTIQHNQSLDTKEITPLILDIEHICQVAIRRNRKIIDSYHWIKNFIK